MSFYNFGHLRIIKKECSIYIPDGDREFLRIWFILMCVEMLRLRVAFLVSRSCWFAVVALRCLPGFVSLSMRSRRRCHSGEYHGSPCFIGSPVCNASCCISCWVVVVCCIARVAPFRVRGRSLFPRQGKLQFGRQGSCACSMFSSISQLSLSGI